MRAEHQTRSEFLSTFICGASASAEGCAGGKDELQAPAHAPRAVPRTRIDDVSSARLPRVRAGARVEACDFVRSRAVLHLAPFLLTTAPIPSPQRLVACMRQSSLHLFSNRLAPLCRFLLGPDMTSRRASRALFAPSPRSDAAAAAAAAASASAPAAHAYSLRTRSTSSAVLIDEPSENKNKGKGKGRQEDDALDTAYSISPAKPATASPARRRSSASSSPNKKVAGIKRAAGSPEPLSPRKTKLPPKLELSQEEALPPPPHWEETLRVLSAQRTRIVAPVDTMGCEENGREERRADAGRERESEEEERKRERLAVLIGLMLSSQVRKRPLVYRRPRSSTLASRRRTFHLLRPLRPFPDQGCGNSCCGSRASDRAAGRLASRCPPDRLSRGPEWAHQQGRLPQSQDALHSLSRCAPCLGLRRRRAAHARRPVQSAGRRAQDGLPCAARRLGRERRDRRRHARPPPDEQAGLGPDEGRRGDAVEVAVFPPKACEWPFAEAQPARLMKRRSSCTAASTRPSSASARSSACPSGLAASTSPLSARIL